MGNKGKKLKQVAKDKILPVAKDKLHGLALASLAVEQLITNFGFIQPLFGGLAKYILASLWLFRIGFVIYKEKKRNAEMD